MDWENEVVVITGGARGLGKVLAEMYGMRGVSVAVLDLEVPAERSEALEHVRFYRCDVSRLEEVRRVKGRIEEDVRRLQFLLSACLFHLISSARKKKSKPNSYVHSHPIPQSHIPIKIQKRKE